MSQHQSPFTVAHIRMLEIRNRFHALAGKRKWGQSISYMVVNRHFDQTNIAKVIDDDQRAMDKVIHGTKPVIKKTSYDDFDVRIHITLGAKACAAMNGNRELLILQQQGDDIACINLGLLTPARAKELGEYLERLA